MLGAAMMSRTTMENPVWIWQRVNASMCWNRSVSQPSAHVMIINGKATEQFFHPLLVKLTHFIISNGMTLICSIYEKTKNINYYPKILSMIISILSYVCITLPWMWYVSTEFTETRGDEGNCLISF